MIWLSWMETSLLWALSPKVAVLCKQSKGKPSVHCPLPVRALGLQMLQHVRGLLDPSTHTAHSAHHTKTTPQVDVPKVSVSTSSFGKNTKLWHEMLSWMPKRAVQRADFEWVGRAPLWNKTRFYKLVLWHRSYNIWTSCSLILPCSSFDAFGARSSKTALTLRYQAKVLVHHSVLLYLLFYSHFLSLDLAHTRLCFLITSSVHYSVLSSMHPNNIYAPL